MSPVIRGLSTQTLVSDHWLFLQHYHKLSTSLATLPLRDRQLLHVQGLPMLLRLPQIIVQLLL
jgi:hypothetical protein